jgi:hypothetical protein
VEVEGDDPVHPGHLDGVGAHPGPYGYPGLVLLVAFGVAEVGDDGRHRGGTGPFEGIDPEQQFHEVVVGWEGRPLDQEDIPTPYVVQHPHEELPSENRMVSDAPRGQPR